MSAPTRTSSKKNHRFSTIALERVTKALETFEDDGRYGAEEADGEAKFPPPDRGKKALLFMCAAFAIEAIMWGKSSFTIFLPLAIRLFHLFL
jgi:hypothetical protein